MADSGFSVNTSQDPAYFDLLNQIMTQGAGAGWDFNKANTTLQQYGTDFFQQFQNAVGQAPTPEEINTFYQQAAMPVMNTQAGFSATDPAALVQQYIPQAYGSDIKQYQQSQADQQMADLSAKQQAALQQNIGTVNQAIPGIAKNVTDSFMSGPGYQSVLGAMNNSGLLNSGATSTAVGNTLGNDINQQISPLISGLVGQATGQVQSNPGNAFNLGQGAIGGIQNQGYQAQQNMTGYNQQLNDFQMQSQLGKMLAEMSQPSTAQKDIGMAAGAAQAAGGLGQGLAGASQLTWICTQMRKEGVLTSSQVKLLHYHLYKAFWKRPFKFIGYLLFGRLLVGLANKYDTNWRLWKSEFYDNVIVEEDPAKAVDLYAEAFWNLYQNVTARKVLRETSR